MCTIWYDILALDLGPIHIDLLCFINNQSATSLCEMDREKSNHDYTFNKEMKLTKHILRLKFVDSLNVRQLKTKDVLRKDRNSDVG